METLALGSLDLLNASSEGISHLQTSLGAVGIFLAQNVNDPNVMGQMQAAFAKFVQSGQIWALLIGLALGYGFRSLLPG